MDLDPSLLHFLTQPDSPSAQALVGNAAQLRRQGLQVDSGKDGGLLGREFKGVQSPAPCPDNRCRVRGETIQGVGCVRPYCFEFGDLLEFQKWIAGASGSLPKCG
jgi:hypothetical protein